MKKDGQKTFAQIDAGERAAAATITDEQTTRATTEESTPGRMTAASGMYATRIAGEETARAASDAAIAARVGELERRMVFVEGKPALDMGEQAHRRKALEMVLATDGREARRVLKDADQYLAWLTGRTPSDSLDAILPPELLASLKGAERVRLKALRYVMAERDNQLRKGYDTAHDDGHTEGELAFFAAQALASVVGGEALPPQRLEEAAEGRDWINQSQHEAVVIAQAIAMAMAELERLIRRGELEASTAPLETAPPVATPPETVFHMPEPHAYKPDPFLGKVGDVQPAATPSAPVIGRQPDEDDFCIMHDALGRPHTATRRTVKNVYYAHRDSVDFERMRTLPEYFVMLAPDGPTPESVGFQVTKAGREALARYCLDRSVRENKTWAWELDNATWPLFGWEGEE